MRLSAIWRKRGFAVVVRYAIVTVADRDGDGRSVKHRVTVCNNEDNRMDTLSPLLDKSR